MSKDKDVHSDPFVHVQGRVRVSWRGGTARSRIAASVLASTLAAGLAAGAVGGATTTASAATRTANAMRLQSVAPAPRLALLGDHAVGAVKSSAAVSGAVALKPRSQLAIRTFIREVSDPKSPTYHHYLSRGQYEGRFGPTQAAISAVRQDLQASGLRVTKVSSNGLLVQFSGTAGHAEAAFHTGLVRVALAHGGFGQATTQSIRLPHAIARDVQAVIGLDSLVHETSTAVVAKHHLGHAVAAPKQIARTSGYGGPVACSDPNLQLAESEGALTDQQVASSYGLNPLYQNNQLASGQTVDIYELEPFATTDVQQFDQCYFGADHTSQITPITVDGGPGQGYGSGEAALDVDDVSALAPGAAIHVFEGPNMDSNFGPLDTWNAIAVADDASQVSTSWGICEPAAQAGAPGLLQVENDIFEQTAAQGQSVFAAAGDDGSDSCAYHASTPVAPDLSVLDPAAQPYVTAVGGTTILDASTPPAETVWDNGTTGGGGGGGVSSVWQMPSWQSGSISSEETSNQACSDDSSGTADVAHLAGFPTTLSSGTDCRELPDVSALADPQSGITIVYQGQWLPIGGTSSATPLWAAMTAEMNGDTSACTTNLGFISPLLYAVGEGSNASSAFNDITAGNNDNLGVGTGTQYVATKGYDLASGLGTPQITNADDEGLVNQLCALASGASTAPTRPSVSSVAPSSGVIAGGIPVTITGTNFGTTQGSVYFGNVAAPVTAWTSTQIMVTTPAYYAPSGNPAGSAGAAVVTVTTAAPAESSSPSAATVFHYTAGSTASPAPVIDYVASPAGPAAGGASVTIVGSGFEEGGGINLNNVTFGGVAATNVTVLSDSEITAVTPVESPFGCMYTDPSVCQVEVQVENNDGQFSAESNILPAYQGSVVYQPDGAFTAPTGCGCEIIQAPTEYDYAPVPTITSVSPSYASENGGTPVTLTGTGFNFLTWYWVNFGPAGDNTSQDFAIDGVTPTTFTVTAPADPDLTSGFTGPPDTSVPLSIQTGGGLATAPSSAFAYAGIPTVSSLSKTFGPQSGGQTLTIRGTDFEDADAVYFVGQDGLSFLYSEVTNFTVHDANAEITLTTPAFYGISTDVLVCSATDCDPSNPKVDTYNFAYAGRPVVNSSSPKSGGEQGGTLVTIQGQLDGDLTGVFFGKRAATILQAPFASPSGPIVVLSPPSTSTGKVDITIATLGGQLVGQKTSATTTAATFTYSKSAPSAPQGLKLTAGRDSATATWNAPFTDGGYAITKYVVTAKSKGESTVSQTVTSRTATLTGLVAKHKYTVSVVAVNKLGKGLPATAKVTPT